MIEGTIMNTKKIGMIFSGQGSQSLGMGKDFYDKHRIVQEYFEEASSCLEQNFVRLCFASSDRELKETVNAQTSIFLVSAAIVMLLQSKYNIKPDIVAGHSSGEYSALFAAVGITFADGLYLLKKRATFMDEATKKYPGGMMAVLNLPYQTLQEICDEYDDGTNENVAEIVNHNSSTQLVVSGTIAALEQIAVEVKTYVGKAIMLNVAGAFHSRLMKEAADLFALYMVKVDFKDLAVPLVNNIGAEVVTTGEQVHTSIKTQMSSPVFWYQSMHRFHDCDIILQIGPDEKLSKMLARDMPDKVVMAINTEKDIEILLSLLEKDVVKREHDESCDKQDCALEELVIVDVVAGTSDMVNKCSGQQDIVIAEPPVLEDPAVTEPIVSEMPIEIEHEQDDN